jgi:hypothetical protein
MVSYTKLLSIAALSLSSVIFLFESAGGLVMANESRAEWKAQLQRLHTATDVTLMIIPSGVTFRFKVDERRLPEVACVYQIQSGLGPSFEDIVKILDAGILKYQRETKRISEARIGIQFRNEKKVLQEFYFEDWGGTRDVNGIAGEYWILGSADIPNRLRALLTQRDVVLIQSGNLACPHS